MIALDIAPGSDRAFGFEKLENFDAGKWRALREKARARRRPVHALPIYGSDKSGTALGLALSAVHGNEIAGAREYGVFRM